MSARNVLYIYPNAKLGGAEQVTSLVVRHHTASKWKPLIYFLTDGPLVGDLHRIGIQCYVFQGNRPRLKNPLSVARAAWDIARVARSERIDLIHSVMGYGHIFGGAAAALAKVPEVWFQHGPTGQLDWITGRVPTRSILVNSYYIKKLQESYYPTCKRMRLVYPATEQVQAEQYAEAALQFRTHHGLSSQDLVIGILARISPMKGQGLLFEALSRLVRDYPSARLLVMGDTFMPGDEEYKKNLQIKAKSLGIEKNVIWTGFVPYPQYAAIAACDVLVNSSTIPEPFGMSIVEAMMLSKPVVAPQAGGPMEIITHQTDGLLFEAGNPLDLADQLAWLAESPDRRKSLGQNAYKTATERFTIQRMVEELESEYDRLIEEKL